MRDSPDPFYGCRCHPQGQIADLLDQTLTPSPDEMKGKNFVSVKGGCLEGLDWSKAIHIWTKSAMVPIPEDATCSEEECSVFDAFGSSQETLDQPHTVRGATGERISSKYDR